MFYAIWALGQRAKQLVLLTEGRYLKREILFLKKKVGGSRLRTTAIFSRLITIPDGEFDWGGTFSKF
jgi:hypothetical protein